MNGEREEDLNEDEDVGLINVYYPIASILYRIITRY